jgi:hypothetical protein
MATAAYLSRSAPLGPALYNPPLPNERKQWLTQHAQGGESYSTADRGTRQQSFAFPAQNLLFRQILLARSRLRGDHEL